MHVKRKVYHSLGNCDGSKSFGYYGMKTSEKIGLHLIEKTSYERAVFVAALGNVIL